MKLKTEQYKGYPVKFVEKIMGKQKLVVGEFPSKVTGRMLGAQAASKDTAWAKCKTMIDKEIKFKGF
jgi:hypothetical protein